MPNSKLYLHSIMYLLIREVMSIKDEYTAFTFHNVSINSWFPAMFEGTLDSIYIP